MQIIPNITSRIIFKENLILKKPFSGEL